MTALNRQHIVDLQGVARMAVDATLGVTELVEQLHRTIQRRPLPWTRDSGDGRTRGITGFVYRSVQETTRLVGAGVDVAFGPLAAWAAVGESSPSRDAIVSAVNGLYGDYLARTGNPLAIDMSLRFEDRRLDPAGPDSLRAAFAQRPAKKRLLVLVHGLCLNERHWMRNGHDHGTALARELGFVPLYVRYNTGLPVAMNGRVLARTLERLLRALPVPAPEVSIIAHSMGGLVTRSALHHAIRRRHVWQSRVRACVFLGTPHHGAPLERLGHGVDRLLELSPYVAPFTRLGRARSAGITDLRHGSVTDQARQFVPLPRRVRFHAIGATLASKRGALSDRLVGDGLVPLDSALGPHSDPSRDLMIPACRQWIGCDMGHLDLLSRTDVYGRLRDWLA